VNKNLANTNNKAVSSIANNQTQKTTHPSSTNNTINSVNNLESIKNGINNKQEKSQQQDSQNKPSDLSLMINEISSMRCEYYLNSIIFWAVVRIVRG
jgi:hypothetical protein